MQGVLRTAHGGNMISPVLWAAHTARTTEVTNHRLGSYRGDPEGVKFSLFISQNQFLGEVEMKHPQRK